MLSCGISPIRVPVLLPSSPNVCYNYNNEMDPTQDHGPDTGDFLTEMAQGASIPNDAGCQHTISCVPRPEQRDESSQFNNQGISEPTTAFAADNPGAMPQDTMDMGATGEVVTGTGNTLGAENEAKRV